MLGSQIGVPQTARLLRRLQDDLLRLRFEPVQHGSASSTAGGSGEIGIPVGGQGPEYEPRSRLISSRAVT
jgi:hypothetical protein